MSETTAGRFTPNGYGWDEGDGRVRSLWLNKRGVLVERFDALPCPKCGSSRLEFFANLVTCLECDHDGPAQVGPEFVCDWREAIKDWNNDPKRALKEPWKMVTNFVPEPEPKAS